mgnify:CR=1 FL=1
MSISSTNSRNNYTGNNSTDTYSYTFRILDQDDLLVTVRDTDDVETTLALTTDYTVTGVGGSSGGTIVLVAGNLATGYILSIRRVVPLVQETDIRNQGAFYPEIHEDQFDRQVMMAQQQQDEVDRSVKLAETIDPADFDTRLPASIVGAVNQTVMTNAAGDGFEAGPTAAAITTAEANATAAAASAVAAAASAATASAAALSATASQWNDVQYLTSASSPFTVTDAMAGTMFEVDASGGAVTMNLPAISGLTLTGPWSIGIKKTDSSANAVTASRNGTDTIDGATTKVTSRQYGGFVLIPDIDPSPDKWTSISFGEVPISGAIVGTTDTQTLTNKTFGDAQILTDISTPSTPSSGLKKVYAKTDGVYSLDSSGTERRLSQKTPTFQILTSGSTYTKPSGVLYIEVEAVGAGGAGAANGSGPSNGTAGGSTTFGSVTCGGGGFAASGGGGTGGGGGTNTTAYTNILSITGQAGPPGGYATDMPGANGASTLLSAGGTGGARGAGGTAPGQTPVGYGGGGGGAGGNATYASGAGGGAGGYQRFIIDAPSATYSYSIGAGGTLGGAGGGGNNSGAGANGIIIVKEFYS